jgi:Flp pilus assembly pilin Flp
MKKFSRFLHSIHREETGQDLAEYCLLTALIALIGLGIFVHISGGMQALWGGANTSLTAGNTAISGTTGAGSAATSAPAH